MNNNHIAVGFYPNGSYKINIVKDTDLENNIEYNKTFRPGRLYFVDGQHVCGGDSMDNEHREKFIAECKEVLKNLKVDSRKVTIPYV